MARHDAVTVEDAITSEILRSALAVAVEEASIIVVRSSHSTWIQEGADAASALLDATGQLVAQSASTSLMHSASLRCCLQSVLAEIPLEEMAPGDVFALNDPYRGGIHANDIVVLKPVFVDGRPRWFGGTVIHVADLGGVAAGGLAALATDTYAEGVLLPPVWLFNEGKPNRDVFGILERNSRAPDKVVGDVKALVAGANVVARRIEELAERYGTAELERHIAELLDYAERRMREELRALPAGTFEGSFTIDGDGVEPGRTFDVRAQVTLDDGNARVDLTGTSAQSGGAINSSYSQTMSGIVFAVRCFLDPSIPMNEGCFRAIEMVLPKGSLVNPNPPAACGGRIVTVAAAIEAIIQAMAAADPDHAVASSGLIHVFAVSGKTAAGQGWLHMGYEFGGIGGRSGSDGPDATGAFFLGGRSVIPQIEPLEAQLPYVTEFCRLATDSGGAGTWRGGLGIEMGMRMLSDTDLTVRGDRINLPPPGIAGGEPGASGSYKVQRLDGTVEVLRPRQQHVSVGAGEVFIITTSGGGGVGPAAERDPVHLADDLAEGRVSLDGARRDYGPELAEAAVAAGAAATTTGTTDPTEEGA
jgi:N-methylhydantoinase B